MSRPIDGRWISWLSYEKDEYRESKLLEDAPEEIKKLYKEYHDDYVRRFKEAQEKGKFMEK